MAAILLGLQEELLKIRCETQMRQVSEAFPPLCVLGEIQADGCGNVFPWIFHVLANAAMKSCANAHVCGMYCYPLNH